MAKTSGTKKNTSQSSRTKTTKAKQGYTQPPKSAADYQKDNELFEEIGLIIFFVLMILLFLCNFGIPQGGLSVRERKRVGNHSSF